MSSCNLKYTIRDGVIYTENVLKAIVNKLNSNDNKLIVYDKDTKEEIVINDTCKEMLLHYFKGLLLDL